MRITGALAACLLLAAGAAAPAGESTASETEAALLAELMAAKAELASFKAQLLQAGKLPTGAAAAAVPRAEGDKLDVLTFIADVEDRGISGEAIWTKHLSGRTERELMAAGREAVAQHAPTAARLALTAGGACVNATDRSVMDLLKTHLESCPLAANVFRGAVHTAVLTNKVTDQFRDACKDRCWDHFNALLGPVARAFQNKTGHGSDHDPRTLWVSEVDALHLALCKPLLDAVVASCGDRDGCDATPLAQAHAYIGDASTVVELIEHGYKVDGMAKGDTQFRPLPSLLVRRGEVGKAWQVVHADPELGLQADVYGVSVLDLIESHGAAESSGGTDGWAGWAGAVARLPLGMAKPGDGGFAELEKEADARAPAHRKKAARDARRKANNHGKKWGGGWPASPEVAFPGSPGKPGTAGTARPAGWDDAQDGAWQPDPSDVDHVCGIAELDGYAVAQDPERFVREFVLKMRPVMLRDYLRHDPALRPLGGALSNKTLLAAHGASLWSGGEGAYAGGGGGGGGGGGEGGEGGTTKTGGRTTLAAFAAAIHAGTGGLEYIYSGTSTPSATAATSYPSGEAPPRDGALKLFPHAPTWFTAGIPGVVEFQAVETQFYLGGAGTGLQLHYHGPAWNALAHGKKGWVLVPPHAAAFSVAPAAAIMAQLVNEEVSGGGASSGADHGNALSEEQQERRRRRAQKRPVLRCVQHGGDVLVLPGDWGHATLNLAASVGIAKEFDFKAFDPEKVAGGKKKRKPKKPVHPPGFDASGQREGPGDDNDDDDDDDRPRVDPAAAAAATKGPPKSQPKTTALGSEDLANKIRKKLKKLNNANRDGGGGGGDDDDDDEEAEMKNLIRKQLEREGRSPDEL